MFEEKSVFSARDAAIATDNHSTAPDPYGLDFNGDRHPDILWHNPVSGENSLWYMEGETGSQYRTSVAIDPMSGEWHVQSALDFNLDGQQDLLWRNELTGQNEVWFMGGENGQTRQSTGAIASIGSDWDAVGAADFDRDGRGDLLWRNNRTGENQVWFMGGSDGTTVLSKESLRTVGDNWEIGGVGDFNKDGQADILWRHNGQGKNALWLMGGNKGTELKNGEALKSVGGRWKIHGVADFDQDGTSDIFWRDEAEGKNALWYMTGANGTEIKSDAVLPYLSGPWQPIVTGWRSPTIDSPTPPDINPDAKNPEDLESSDGSFNIQFDYRFDNLNWFDKQKRAVLEAAASIWEKIIKDDFNNIKAGTTVHASHPTSGSIQSFQLDYEIDDIVVFAYANNMGGAGGQLAEAGATTYVGDRNTASVFQPWLGEIEFDISEAWYLDPNTREDIDVPDSQVDFLSVAVHELGHILGVSSSIAAFKALINSRGEFTGQAATAINGGQPIPLDGVRSHIKDNFTVPGLGENSLDPTLQIGTRKLLTALDVALVDDIGYTVDYSSLKPASQVKVLSIMQNNQEVTNLQANTTYTLRWDDNFSESVKIELFEGNTFIRTIDSATASDGSFTWNAPAELASSNRYYRLKVSSIEDPRIHSFSDRPFLIQPVQPKPFISGSTFNDSTLKIGNQYNLVWNDNLNETVKIELYKGDQFSRTITASTLSDGRYEWKVPSHIPKGDGYRLKLTSTKDASLYNFSTVFTIHS